MLIIVNNYLRCRGMLSKLSIDATPIFLVPFIFLISSMSFNWTVGTFICTIVGFLFLKRRLSQVRPRSSFFMVWFTATVIWLVWVFNIYVIAMTEILPEENFLLVLFIIISLGCLYHCKMKAQKTLLPVNKAACINGDFDDDIDNLIAIQNVDQPFFCRHCQANVQVKNHCLWLDCCIGPENDRLFVVGSLFGFLALTYGSNLTFTTICHPFIFYYPYLRLLLPDDCSDVYLTTSTSISFVSAAYSAFMSLQVGWFLLKTVIRMCNKKGLQRCCILLKM